MGNILYLDCLSGISGDMTIGALLDLGVDKDELLQQLKKIDIEGYEIEIKQGQKNGITGTNFDVIINDHHTGEGYHEHHDHQHNHAHRNFYDVEKIIDGSQLNDGVKNLSKKIFKFVAEAEGKVHNKSLEEVHFHEVGAIDSIIDIIGTAICLDKLNIDKIYASPLHVGTGFVNCTHGNIPVPAPATLEILKGIPIYSKGIQSELVTPTGAAIVKALAHDFKPLPKMSIQEIGYGLGKKDLEISNVLRVTLGKKKR